MAYRLTYTNPRGGKTHSKYGSPDHQYKIDWDWYNTQPNYQKAWQELGNKKQSHVGGELAKMFSSGPVHDVGNPNYMYMPGEPVRDTKFDEKLEILGLEKYMAGGSGGGGNQTSFTDTNEYKDLKWQIDNLRGLLDAKKDPTPIGETPEYIQATEKLTAQEGQIGDLSKQLRALRAQGGSGWSSTMNRAPMGVKIKQSPGYKTGRTFQGAGGSFAKGGLRISGLNFA